MSLRSSVAGVGGREVDVDGGGEEDDEQEGNDAARGDRSGKGGSAGAASSEAILRARGRAMETKGNKEVVRSRRNEGISIQQPLTLLSLPFGSPVGVALPRGAPLDTIEASTGSTAWTKSSLPLSPRLVFSHFPLRRPLLLLQSSHVRHSTPVPSFLSRPPPRPLINTPLTPLPWPFPSVPVLLPPYFAPYLPQTLTTSSTVLCTVSFPASLPAPLRRSASKERGSVTLSSRGESVRSVFASRKRFVVALERS